MTRSPAYDAVSLCEQAARQEFYKAELLNNLGRVYLMSGQRKKAYDMFKKGIETDPEFFKNHLCLEAMGVRSRPVFGFLGRNHPVNVVTGKTMRRLGLRV